MDFCNHSSTCFKLPITDEQAFRSSFDIYPIHCSVYLSFAVASAVGVLVFAVVAVDVAVVALRASRKQSMHLILLVSVP